MDGRPEIPLFEIGSGGGRAIFAAEPVRAHALIASARRMYTPPVMALADKLSVAWLARSANPHRAEIAEIGVRVGRPGAAMLNLSFEWACTTSAVADPTGPGNRLLRTLDWPFHGLGRNVVVARESGPAGEFLNVTWPGAVVVLTAMAPGRFAAAINQAPMARRGLGLIGDWAVNRVRLWHQRTLPPSHLLRRVFETARDFAEAKAMLTRTPIALPVLYTLSGIGADEGCVIERQETTAVVRAAPAVCANDWVATPVAGRPRGRDNEARRAQLARAAAEAGEGFDWLTPPVLNGETRLAVAANAARGRLAVLGVEKDGPATREFRWGFN